MIDKVFKVDSNDNLIFDYETMEQLTDTQFVDLVQSKLSGYYVKEVKFAGDRRAQFVYFNLESVSDFSTSNKYYSFSFDKKTETIIFSEQLKKSKWKMVVGWKPQGRLSC